MVWHEVMWVLSNLSWVMWQLIRKSVPIISDFLEQFLVSASSLAPPSEHCFWVLVSKCPLSLALSYVESISCLSYFDCQKRINFWILWKKSKSISYIFSRICLFLKRKNIISSSSSLILLSWFIRCHLPYFSIKNLDCLVQWADIS